jgi:hypothetical protein
MTGARKGARFALRYTASSWQYATSVTDAVGVTQQVVRFQQR